jgi:CTP:molybdopterin cytidylyltransferase MocA
VLIDLALRDDLLRLDETRGLRALLDQKRDLLHCVSVSSPYVVRDIDTWAEYCALHEEIFGRREAT